MKTQFDINGFTAELAVAGDYYKLTYQGETIWQDSAYEDCYDEDSAEAFFESILDEAGEKAVAVIKRAIGLGYKVGNNEANDLEYLEGNCEEYLFDTIMQDKFEQCDLHAHGISQYYNYNGHTCSGEIFDFADRRTKQYYKDADFTKEPVSEVWIDDEDRENYAFIFDRVIDNEAQVVALYDYLAN